MQNIRESVGRKNILLMGESQKKGSGGEDQMGVLSPKWGNWKPCFVTNTT